MIFSTPIVVTVKTDSTGAWDYTLDTQLDDGSHKLYVANVDDSGRIVAESPAVPFTKQAEAISYTPLIVSVSPSPNPMDTLRDNFFILAGVAVVIFALVTLLILGMAHRKAYSEIGGPGGPATV
jgi:hypothetical protein